MELSEEEEEGAAEDVTGGADAMTWLSLRKLILGGICSNVFPPRPSGEAVEASSNLMESDEDDICVHTHRERGREGDRDVREKKKEKRKSRVIQSSRGNEKL